MRAPKTGGPPEAAGASKARASGVGTADLPPAASATAVRPSLVLVLCLQGNSESHWLCAGPRHWRSLREGIDVTFHKSEATFSWVVAYYSYCTQLEARRCERVRRKPRLTDRCRRDCQASS